MLKTPLKDHWFMQVLGDAPFPLGSQAIETSVPATVYSVLLDKGLMPDPYYRENELDAQRLMNCDFVFTTSVAFPQAMAGCQAIDLCFEGLDTLADVYLNGELLGRCNNMHRRWLFPVAGRLKRTNELRVVLLSPLRFLQEHRHEIYGDGSGDCLDGFQLIRKAHCMFGWDWGPRLPDAGIFRPVYLLGYNQVRIDDVYITQHHGITGTGSQGNQVSHVDIAARVQCTAFGEGTVQLHGCVEAPDGKAFPLTCTSIAAPDGCMLLQGRVDSPALWWPNGYGSQPLYTVRITAENQGCLDVWERKIGLRTLTVNTEELPHETLDEHMQNQEKDSRPGRNFAFEINGLQIFAQGANYIPEDCIIPRITPERTKRLLADACACHHNMIRVWGGAWFPEDWFYDLCDACGLIVWQDLLFACTQYLYTDEFVENCLAEIADNVRRIRHHAALGLWCGNNEIELMTLKGSLHATGEQTEKYLLFFEKQIPQLLARLDPQTFFWPSSPSSGGQYDIPAAENIGDSHYWGVWHGNEPFTAYRNHHNRFNSEFGFQAFPAMQTICSFTCEEDRNPFSRVMEMHQRNRNANGIILRYLSSTYLFPSSFPMLVYASQLVQADAIRYGVEHYRRSRGTCMGALIWQLNDNWPVISWSGIDYYGRWKALQYAEKRFFAPVSITCMEHGEIDQKAYVHAQRTDIELSAQLHVANETCRQLSGRVAWALRLPDSTIVMQGSQLVTVPPFGGTWLPKLDFSGQDPCMVHLEYAFIADGRTVSRGTTLFCAPKHYHFQDPHLTVSREGPVLTIHAAAFAKAVFLDFQDGNGRLEDNFFDMEAGTVSIRMLTDNETAVSCFSVFDIDKQPSAGR